MICHILLTLGRVGQLLRTYRSGPLPKIFKIIPSLPAWARILALTGPENWSPHACRAATRIFVSTMKPPQVQLFLNVVLLDAIRADIGENKKLNVHYYESLKRALYKPGAFFKGIIFPLLAVCTSHSFVVSLLIYRSKGPLLKKLQSLLLFWPKRRFLYSTHPQLSCELQKWTTQVRPSM